MSRSLLLLAVLAATGCRRGDEPPLLQFEPEPRRIDALNGRDARVVVRPSGDLFAVLVRPVGEGADLVLANSMNGGDGFEESLTLNPVPGEVRAHGLGAAPLLLLGPRSEFYAIWATRTALRVSRSKTFARTFEPPVDVPTGGSAPSFFNAAVAPDGTLLVTWLGAVAGRSSAPGTSFVSVAATRDLAQFEIFPGIAEGICPCCRPAIIADEVGRWWVSFRTNREGIRDVAVSFSVDRGKGWSRPELVNRDAWKFEGCPHSGPALAVAGGQLHVAWYSEGGGAPHLYWTRTRDGSSFERPRSLSAELLDPNQPVLTASGSSVVAAFLARDPAARGGWAPLGVYVRPLLDDAPAPLRVPSGRGSASAPELRSLGAGRWLVAWTDRAEEASAVLARARTVQP